MSKFLQFQSKNIYIGQVRYLLQNFFVEDSTPTTSEMDYWFKVWEDAVIVLATKGSTSLDLGNCFKTNKKNACFEATHEVPSGEHHWSPLHATLPADRGRPQEMSAMPLTSLSCRHHNLVECYMHTLDSAQNETNADHPAVISQQQTLKMARVRPLPSLPSNGHFGKWRNLGMIP